MTRRRRGDGIRAAVLAASPGSRRRFLGAATALTISLATELALASADIQLRYTRQQVFSGALRYLRIDLGYEVTEKNPDAAYLLFEYVPHGKQERAFGAFEIIDTDAGVRLAVKLPTLPAYHENVLRDGLVKKLRADYGEEPAKPPSARPEKAPKKRRKGDAEEAPNAPEEGTKDDASE